MIDTALGMESFERPFTWLRRVALAALMCIPTLGNPVLAQAFDPLTVIVGRWAPDPVDCDYNRNVWHFTTDYVGVLIDNVPSPRYYRATWVAFGRDLTLTYGAEDNFTASYAFRLLNERQLDVTRIVMRGIERPLGPVNRWQKCP
ncbi:MAG: hypothetical protein HY057_09905 [Rhodospirillales bacterium]|nr:hypothetical protein [Rhodospirillales bacterium]